MSVLLAGQMTKYAASLLADGRHREAAAVFEFAASQEPYNGLFRNNLGFCLIPENILEALGHLEAAGLLYNSVRTVNVYNRMCCHIALHRSRDALALADTNWFDIRNSREDGATLWRKAADSDSWVLFHTDDERVAVAELAIDVACDEGWLDDERVWHSRLEELGC
jgi:hypothetical protein